MTNIVRAKFRVNSAIPEANGTTVVGLSAVVGGEENASWSKATPAGNLTMVIGNPVATELFEVGRILHLDFSEA